MCALERQVLTSVLVCGRRAAFTLAISVVSANSTVTLFLLLTLFR